MAVWTFGVQLSWNAKLILWAVLASCSTQARDGYGPAQYKSHMAQKPLLWVETGVYCMRCVKGQSAMGCDGQAWVSGSFGLENSGCARYIQPERMARAVGKAEGPEIKRLFEEGLEG